MVENTDINTTTSGVVETRRKAEKRFEVEELRMRVEGIAEEERKILYVINRMGEEGFKWYVELRIKPNNFSDFKKLVLEKWELEEIEKKYKEEKMNVEEMIRKGISEGLKEKFRNENLDRRRTSYNFRRDYNNYNSRSSYDMSMSARDLNGKVVCYNCGQEGHFSRGCANKRSDDGINKGKLNYGYVENDNYLRINQDQKRYKMSIDVVLNEYPEIIGNNKDKIVFCPVEKCSINTFKEKPICKRGVVIPQALRQKTKEYINELENRGIIRKSNSQWRNPIRAIQKPNGEIRLVTNMMSLNDVTIKDNYRLADMKKIIEATTGSNHLTILDLKDAYYQIEIEEKHRYKTAFEFENNVYEWNGMMQGFKNAPMVCQRIMHKIFGDLIGNGVEVYMDDVIIYARTEEEHENLIRKVIRLLIQNNLKINVKKIQYNQSEVKLLGLTVNGRDKEPPEVKRNKALEFPRPRTIIEIQRFLGLSNWFRAFIPNYAVITRDLYEVIGGNKNFYWNDKQEISFQNVKNALRNAQNLKLPEYDKKFVLKTDASNTGMGAVLLQENVDGKLIPVQWASKKLSPTEMRYSVSEKECLAVLFGVKKFSYELRGRKFHLITDHKALEKIRTKPEYNNDRINRFIEKLQDYDFSIEYRKGIELVDADALSRIYENDVKKDLGAEKSKNEKGEAIKKGKLEKHIFEVDGKKYWRFDRGIIKIVPDEEMRRTLIIDCHEKFLHRGKDTIYYELKEKYYWMGMQDDIIEVIKRCEVCNIKNRKKSGGCNFVTTKKPFERIAIDILDLNLEGKKVLVMIDYFSRYVKMDFIQNRKSETITNILDRFFESMHFPEIIVTDNAKEFSGEVFLLWCQNHGINHHLVAPESHRSNGRIERVIGTIREGLEKCKINNINEKLQYVEETYNNCYHEGIKCKPIEALRDLTGIASLNNSIEGKYNKQFKKGFREQFKINQQVRVSKKENLGKQGKSVRGRFLRRGVVVDVLDQDSYLVKMDDGKISKKRHYELKGLVVV